MLKKLAIAIVVVSLLVGGAVAYLLYNASALVKRYEPELERSASESLGATVAFDGIGVSVIPATRLTVARVDISNPEKPEETLSFEDLSLRLNLLALLRRRLEITSLSLANPNLTFTLDESGVQLAGFPTTSAPDDTGTVDEETAADTPAIDIRLDAFALRNATITIRDVQADTEYVIKELDIDSAFELAEDVARLPVLSGSGITLDDVGFAFDGADLAYELESSVLRIGRLDFETLGNSLRTSGELEPGNPERAVTIQSERIDLASLRPVYDALAPIGSEMGLEGIAAPDLKFALAQDGGYRASGGVSVSGVAATLADTHFSSLAGQIQLEANEKEQRVSGQGLTGQVEGVSGEIDLAARLTPEDAQLENLEARTFGGTANVTAAIDLTDEQMPFTSEMKIASMDFAQMVQAYTSDSSVRITGTLESVNGDVTGTLDENMLPSITGGAGLALVDGLVKNVNLGEKVLGSVSEFPFLSGTLLNAVPESSRAFLQKEHTVLESVDGTFTIGNEQLQTSDLSVTSDFFTLDASGTIGFDTRLDLDSNIHFNPAFSAGMADKVKELSPLLDGEGRLSFPVKVSGIPPDLSVVPDVAGLLGKAVRGTIEDKATDALTDALGEDAAPLTGVVNRLLGGRGKKDEPKADPQE